MLIRELAFSLCTGSCILSLQHSLHSNISISLRVTCGCCCLLNCFNHVRLCDPIDSLPPGSPVPGILQATTLEWVAISLSNTWKWKVKGSRSVVSDSQGPHGLQPTRLLRPWDFPGKSTGVGCHCFLQRKQTSNCQTPAFRTTHRSSAQLAQGQRALERSCLPARPPSLGVSCKQV